ncbi:MAG: exo-alpha-sialidase [Planctomycetes bacterium]|nr:exo-alpha-sialidase [Planctomycetota bacterium]
MSRLEILGTGRIDERESAFPQAVQLPNGDLLCSFSVGGGQYVHGGTDWYRSRDRGATWVLEGTILPPTDSPRSANYLKLSLSPDGQTVFAYGTRYWGETIDRFGQRRGEAVLCRSRDAGRSWTAPQVLPMPDTMLEISHALRPLRSGRLLAPAAYLSQQDRLGEEVFVLLSDDEGASWPHRRTVFRDPAGERGFWEQKLLEVRPGLLLATAWTVTLGDYRDLENSFCWSHDDGWTWGPIHSTGIRGQTMTPMALGDDRLLVLYNRRYGRQGIVAAVVDATPSSWRLLDETIYYDAGAMRDGPQQGSTGVDELASFQFGFPTAIPLDDGTWLGTHWCVEREVCGIRWTRFRVHS